jgi:hypothetical protein
LRRNTQNYLRVIIISKSLCKGVVVNFQLCNLEKRKNDNCDSAFYIGRLCFPRIYYVLLFTRA